MAYESAGFAELCTDGIFQDQATGDAVRIRRLSITKGDDGGGTQVIMYVSGASASGNTITIGGNAATIVSESETQIIFTTPAGAIGTEDVRITTAGALTDTLTDGWEYQDLASKPILTLIEEEIQTIIEGLDTVDGYNYSWNTVNIRDEAHNTFPSALVELVEEINIDPNNGSHSRAYLNRAEFRITAKGQISAEPDFSNGETPWNQIRFVHNKLLDDLKKAFGTNYSLNDSAHSILYNRSERNRQASGDIFRDANLVTFWTVQYMQDRQTPRQPV